MNLLFCSNISRIYCRTKALVVFLFALCALTAAGQNYDQASIENHKRMLAAATEDSTRLHYADTLFFYDYIWSYPDSAAPYREQIFLLAKKLNDLHYLAKSYWGLELLNEYIGDFPEGLKASLEGIRIVEQTSDFIDLSLLNMATGELYSELGDFDKAIHYLNRAKFVLQSHGVPSPIISPDENSFYYLAIWERMARLYTNFNHLDSALHYAILYKEGTFKAFKDSSSALISFNFGNIYSKMGDYKGAVASYQTGISRATKAYLVRDLTDCLMGLSKTYLLMGEIDSSVVYANKVLNETGSNFFLNQKIVALNLLSDIYRKRNKIDSVAKFLSLEISARDNLFSQQKMFKIQNLTFSEQTRQIELADQLRRYREKIILYSTLAALFVFLAIVFILWRNNRQKEKAYAQLQLQKQETELQKSKVENALEELKVAQIQLIQSEKMASLGELTAGIAHEIQNPINFVNNFSEINTELIHEIFQATEEGNTLEAGKLIRDVQANEEKIKFHGQRVDAIVKGMLQHARTSSGQKESADINNLVSEYLKLSYLGIRSRDKSFVADIQTNFDSHVGSLQIIPQDIGRVLLNLFNNAFYALAEKKNGSDGNYQPSLYVSTTKINGKVLITVRDNGNGVPKQWQEKIFQPFFTTKPTGQGTGLGLSISYDIVKVHGGEINLATTEGEFTEFTIQLPA